MEKNEFPFKRFILKSQLEMRGMTNVNQITPDRQSKFKISLLTVGEEKKNSQGNRVKKKKDNIFSPLEMQ